MNELITGMAKLASTMYNKKDLEKRLASALKELQTDYGVPKDQLKELEEQAAEVLDLMPNKRVYKNG